MQADIARTFGVDATTIGRLQPDSGPSGLIDYRVGYQTQFFSSFTAVEIDVLAQRAGDQGDGLIP
jgi:hypothetical protein